ncbi:5-formyltetrahydrofolate cyclo-ligase [Rhodoferax sp. GW822-FHT02A01]|uniref:5-formyltetrahydrofolate cyclo-ligase n=1 Tax=Rhodoferax sp. GW822-FHT02A01 TaxID=3141537 RepID=UPI00315C4CE4
MAPEDIKAWKAATRKELIARRMAVSDADRKAWNAAITQLLIDGFPQLTGMTIGLYWPYQGEFDPRFAVHHFRDLGATAALPEVVRKAEPLRFRAWWPGVAMTTGVYDIPVPDGTDVVTPQALIMPPVGFDAAGYRLGYGGGFYDRTLASIQPRPLTIGVAYELSRLDTIHPQDFDLPMDYVVTERGIFPTQTPSAT